MKRVLLTAAGGRLAIGLTRALKVAPEPLHLIGVDSHKFMLQRAETDEKYLVPRADEPDYVPCLRSIVDETGTDFLCVGLEAELLPISAARDRVGTRTFLPKHETMALCGSKMGSYEVWRQAGVPVPQSMLLETETDLRRAFQEIGTDLWLREITGTGGKGSLPVSDFAVAKSWIELRRGWGRFMAAQRLEAEAATWESIWRDGELVAAQGRKRHYWEFANLTLSGVTGMTGSWETIADPQVDDISAQAIKAIDPEPHGIMTVNLAYDQRGVPNVTEINAGRFASGEIVYLTPFGPNFAYIMVQLALGEEVDLELPLVNPFPEGIVKDRGMDIEPILTDMGSIDSFEAELQQRRASVSMPLVAP